MKKTRPDPMPDAPPGTMLPTPAGVDGARHAAVACTLALVALGLAWELWLAPLRPGGSWLALKVLPLCLPLAGLLKNRMYTYRWLSLLVWLYVIEGSVRAWSDKGLSAGLALVELLLCVALFVACTVHIRLRLKAARAALANQTPGAGEVSA
jgi:uncharacterized membrane protein